MNSQNDFSHKNLKDSELLSLTLVAAKTEKDATLALLNYLVEIDSRRLYATVNACSSLFEYVVKELGFSEPAAAERVNAVRLMRSVPEVKEHLAAGNLNLTNAAQIQRFVNAEQKADSKGKSLSAEEKKTVVAACLGKSKREVEKTLLEKQSVPARAVTEEKIKAITNDRSEIKFTVSEKTLAKLNQLKDLIGNQPLEKIVDQALDALLMNEQKKRGLTKRIQKKPTPEMLSPENQPLEMRAPKIQVLKTQASKTQKSKISVSKTSISKTQLPIAHALSSTSTAHALSSTSTAHAPSSTSTAHAPANATETHDANFNRPAELSKNHTTLAQARFIPTDLKRFVFARSKGQCEFVDARTKQRCRSTYRLQIDHILPFALNGQTEASNLRHLCSAHNLRMATQAGLHRPASVAA